MLTDRLITVAIHTYDRAHRLKGILEQEGINVNLQNVNLTNPSISAGIRVRIKECDLPHALRIIENIEILSTDLIRDNNRCDGMSILVPVDFSDNSLKACIAAFRIAASINASIHLLHSYIDPAFSSPAMMQLTPTLDYESDNEAEMIMDEKLDRDLYGIARKGMADFENKLRDKVRHGVIPGVSFQSTVTEGLPEESIDNYCSSHHISLVVMGTNGADSSTRNNFGSI
ncbi:MAG: universal stress protein, partial [Duncaniella sp.]|nr:universal stress protein [Duncaniella sp.]